jgi:hypothetical protein
MLNYTNDTESDNISTDSRGKSRAVRHCATWILVAVWSLAAAAGMGLLAAYANNPGKWSSAPTDLGRSDDATSTRYRLFMFLHPRCPCSIASVNELTRIMSRCAAHLDATVYFVRPESQSADWENGTLRKLASEIPRVKLESDIGGSVAAQFRANTSGEVFVYDCRGKLHFHGGITSARGHEGDNLGESAVIDIAMGGESNVERSPVFGCPFRAEAASSRN